MNSPRRRVLWIALAFAAGAASAWRPQPPPPGTPFLPAINATNPVPIFRTGVIEPSPATPHVHCASLAELPDGRLAATWYGGLAELAGDVAIYFATRPPGLDAEWSPGRPIVTRSLVGRELRRGISHLGNATLFADDRGRLGLLFVTTPGGWSCCSLNLKWSTDSGATWTRSQRLVLSPLLNVSDLVKNKPARLAGGGWAVPLYNETARRYPELLWLGDRAYAKRRIAPATDFFQPSLVPLDATRAVALLRDGSPTKAVQRATTEDAGRTWSAPVATALPNPDSGLDAVRLPDGRLLLAFNDAKRQRANLRLAVSRDDGRTWSVVATIEDQPGGAFSYPALLVSRSGNIHLVYSAARRVIKHVIFNAAWLDRVAERGQG